MVNALGMGIATALVLAASNAAVALIRRQVTDAVRLPVFVMIIAALTTCIELLMQAFTYELYQILGIFIPLITTNCIILGRAEAFAAKNSVAHASFDGLMMGTGWPWCGTGTALPSYSAMTMISSTSSVARSTGLALVLDAARAFSASSGTCGGRIPCDLSEGIRSDADSSRSQVSPSAEPASSRPVRIRATSSRRGRTGLSGWRSRKARRFTVRA